MFPQGIQYHAGVFQIMRASAKAKKMERLPPGHNLAAYLSPAQFSRIASLQERGLVAPDFATRRPIFVAYDLIRSAKREQRSDAFLTVGRVDWKADPDAFVRYAADKYRLRLVPMRTERLSAALDEIAQTPIGAQLPCLVAAMDFAEAPSGSYQARSQAWAERRVPDVLVSPAENAFTTCAKLVRNEPDPRPALMAALHQPLTTVAVLELSALGSSGGVLDYLRKQGFEISGPHWRR
jgi:hypothetical protein